MTKTMLKEVMTEPKKIIFEEVEVPKVGKDEVLVKIMRIGICGSDIHVYHGLHPYTSYPVTQGHEVSGVVVALGENASKFKLGDRVTIEPQLVCGTCHPCRNGKYNLCESLRVMGFQAPGAAVEYFAAPENNVTAIGDLSYDEGAMIEPLAVTVHACRRVGDLEGKNIAVMGAGPIGTLLVQSLKACGAAKVLVTDVSDFRLAQAKKLGADWAVNTMDKDYGELLVECFGKDKADVIFDCAGNNITMGQAIQNARKGSVIMLLAVFAGMATVDLAKLNDSELVLDTSMMYRHEDFVDAIRFVNEGKIDLKPLMSKHFAFTDFGLAYEFIDNNREETMKVLIDVAED